ncbi:MAG: thioredoxin family protein [Prevotella sp.]|nr:thioredoxin family protein [Prevotella sp.]MCI6619371.1 thioredoxin family protein [Prevotella sp.]MDY4039245.1 thioredoxin family protein [Prevotella sp.]
MEIIVLGSGCTRCHKAFDVVRQTVGKAGIEADVIFESDIVKILDYNVLSLPAIVVDGEVKMNGQVPTEDEVRQMLHIMQPEER